MSAYPTSPCTFRPCRNRTRDATRRCHLHRGAISHSPAGSPTTPVPVSFEGSWKPGTKTPHPTGGYDFVDADEDSTIYSLDGDYHRTDGPATVRYSRGELSSESWYEKGVRHRTDGPAYISYRTDGSVSGECYFVDGKVHRLDGPAEVFPDDDDEPDRYYLGGHEFESRERFEQIAELVRSGSPLEWALAFAEGQSE